MPQDVLTPMHRAGWPRVQCTASDGAHVWDAVGGSLFCIHCEGEVAMYDGAALQHWWHYVGARVRSRGYGN